MSRALIVVDVQNDFCPGGSLAVAAGADVATAISAALARPGSGPGSEASEASEHDWDHVVATRDHHIEPGDHFSTEPDYVDSWPPHCVAGTPGEELHPNLDRARIEVVFDKGQYTSGYSGFEGAADGVSLADWLRGHDVTTVDVVGIATDHCVRATALDAARAGFDTTVLLDLTAAVAPKTTTRALKQLREVGVRLEGTPALPE